MYTLDLSFIIIPFLPGRASPFRVGVALDSDEVTNEKASDAMSTLNEQSEVPGGITGFQLKYFQVAC